MGTTAATLLQVSLSNPDDEAAFLGWWRDARELLRDRFHLARADLHVLERGRYLASFAFPLPAVWRLVREDRRWKALEKRRPPADVEIRQTRLWQADEHPRDVSTAELVRWLAERDAGRRDLALADALPAESYAREHLPGAVSLPFDDLTPERAEAVLGPRLDRTVVVYCNGYG